MARDPLLQAVAVETSPGDAGEVDLGVGKIGAAEEGIEGRAGNSQLPRRLRRRQDDWKATSRSPLLLDLSPEALQLRVERGQL